MRTANPLIFLALHVAIACAGVSADSGTTNVRDSAGISIASSNPSESGNACTLGPAPRLEIGVAEGPKEYMLHRTFGARRMSDGRIVLASDGSGEIRFYDSTGKHLLSAGRSGEGPGEFRSPFYLWVLPGDTVWVGDYRPWRYLVFSPEGKWVRTVELAPQYLNTPDGFGMLSNGQAVLGRGRSFRPRTGYGADSIEIRIHAATGEEQHNLGWFPNGRWAPAKDSPNNLWLYPLFESFTQFTAAGDRIAISRSAEPEVRVLSASGALVQIIRWNPGDLTVSQADIDAYRTQELSRAANMSEEQRQRYVDPQISAERPTAEKFAAVTKLMYGVDGRLWVRPSRRPMDPVERVWLAFDSDGRFVCRAQLPAGISVYEFGPDYVLGLHEDADDVERVVMYSLTTADRR